MNPCRPRDHLIAAGKRFPDAWVQADSFRSDRGSGLPAWPQWCFLPLAGWYAIVSGGGANRLSLDTVGDVARLAGLGAWRVTQGIYRFDPDLYSAIGDTPISGDLPHDVLYRLPEWCVYIETPGLMWSKAVLHGFFAHLESDANNGRPELRLLLDTESSLTSLPLHLGSWSLAESIRRMTDTASIHAMGAGVSTPTGLAKPLSEAVEPLISLLLYLCSQNAEIGDGRHLPANPKPKKTKRGPRIFAPDKPTTWDVGVRLGAALRQARAAGETGDGVHAGPRPHIRRAHWHGFWSGPKAANRKFSLKWLPPIPVNVESPDELPATIRPVK
jgi:hypothetical protein